MSDENTPARSPDQVDETAREAARQRMISRRRAIRAGIIAAPILLTLRAVPARARVNAETTSEKNCIYVNGKNPSGGLTGNTYTISRHCRH